MAEPLGTIETTLQGKLISKSSCFEDISDLEVQKIISFVINSLQSINQLQRQVNTGELVKLKITNSESRYEIAVGSDRIRINTYSQ